MKPRPYLLMNLPGIYALILFIFAYGGLYLLDLHIQPSSPHPDTLMLGGVRAIVICISAAVFGIWRILRFYPYPGAPYDKWLVLTPWRYGMQMPKGSVMLNITDILVVGTLCLAACLDAKIHPVVPAMIFLYFYIVTAILSTFHGIPATTYYGKKILILIIIPLAFYPVASITNALISLGVCYLLCYSHLRDVLKAYPWNQTVWLGNEEEFLARKSMNFTESGWPYSVLAAERKKPFAVKKSFGRMIILNALIVWWMHSVVSSLAMNIDENDFDVFPGLVVAFSIISVFGRLAFLYRAAPPISFWGRIFNGYFIIPKYDRVFIAPLCVIALMYLSLCFMPESVQAAIWVTDGSVFLILCVAMGFPPSWSQWRNTGAFRMTRNKMQENQMQQMFKNKGLNKPVDEFIIDRIN